MRRTGSPGIKVPMPVDTDDLDGYLVGYLPMRLFNHRIQGELPPRVRGTKDILLLNKPSLHNRHPTIVEPMIARELQLGHIVGPFEVSRLLISSVRLSQVLI